GEKGLKELQAEIAAADEAAVPAAAKQAIALLGREAERIELRLRAIDARLMQQHKANPLTRRLAAIPGVGPIGALNLALRVGQTIHITRVGWRPARSLIRLGVDRGTHLGQRPCAATTGRTHDRNRTASEFLFPTPLRQPGRPHTPYTCFGTH